MLKRDTGSSPNDYPCIAPEVPGDVEQTWLEVSKPKRLLVYSPNNDWKQGLRFFLSWYRKENRDHKKLSV